MDSNVPLQVARLGECFITFLAEIRFHPSMDPNVCLQVERLEECFITCFAFYKVSSQYGS